MSVRARSMLAIACLGLIAAALLVACGDDDPDGATAPPGDTGANGATATTEPAEGTSTSTVEAGGGGTNTPPAPPSFPTSDEPPVTTASANGQSVEMSIGTYCWTRMCVDKIGVPTQAILTLAAGDTVSVAIPGGAPPLREASANAFEALTSMPLDGGGEIWPYPGAPGDDLDYAVTQDGVEVTVDLPPGRYVLAVGMFFESGDAIYGVLLDVQ